MSAAGRIESYFDELCAGLNWSAESLVAMVWGYFDESGEHDKCTGHFTRLTIAGAIAPCEVWQIFSARWKVILQKAGITTMFHMVDFENRRGPFVGWSEEKRRIVLNQLLDEIIEAAPEIVGFVAEPEPGRHALKDSYDSIIAKMTKEAAIGAFSSAIPVTMVFAKHKDFSAKRIGEYFDLWNDTGRLKFGGVADPNSVLPLQAADIIAYELSRWGRRDRPYDDRYPLRKLKDALKIHSKSSKFILTFISSNSFRMPS